MYYVEYELKDGTGIFKSGPFESHRSAEAFVVAFVNRHQVMWIHIVEKLED